MDQRRRKIAQTTAVAVENWWTKAIARVDRGCVGGGDRYGSITGCKAVMMVPVKLPGAVRRLTDSEPTWQRR